ncbi:MAG: sulfurtransferase TusA family protein [Promethearchaeota archaeon]
MGDIYQLNCEGLVCPLPVARTKKQLIQMNGGDFLKITGDFIEAAENIKRFVESHGGKVLEHKIEGNNYYLKIQKL